MAKAKKLASGSWRCQVYSHTETVIDPVTNVKKERRIYRSFTSDDPSPAGRRKAEAMAAEFALHKEDFKITTSYILKEAMERYCETKSNILSPSTLRAYKSLIRNAYPSILDRRTDKLSSVDVQKAINQLSENHSPKYVKNAYGFLTAVMTLYQPDLTLNVKLPQAVRPDTYTPSDAEISRLIEFFRVNDSFMLNAVYLGAFGTLRRSEVCAAAAEDITGNRLFVHKAMIQSENGEWEIRKTKTYSSARFVDLPEFVIAGFPKQGRLVPLTPNMVTDRLRRSLRKLGLPHFRFHDLRHYAASIMHTLGIPDQYIMQQGGWKSDNVLKNIYRNALPDYQKKFLRDMSEHFREIDEGNTAPSTCNTNRKKSKKYATRYATRNKKIP